LSNHLLSQTVYNYPNLFCIVTSINIDIFKSYLITHSNYEFTESLCHSFQERF
ncbi:hypothetical protein AN958_05592, partial [Leucoagaricus sp. SymC.cos]